VQNEGISETERAEETTPVVLTETVRGCSVKIYLNVKGEKTYYRVVDYSSGKRRFIGCEDEKAARKEAKRIAALLAGNDAEGAQLNGQHRQLYLAMVNAIKPLGIDPLAFIVDAVAAKQKWGNRPLTKAVDESLAVEATGLTKKPVKEVVDLLVAARRADGRSEAYVRDLETRLKTFAGKFEVNLSDVTASQVNAFLRSLECGGRSKNNYRRAIATLFRFGEVEKFCLRGHLASKDLARATEAKAAVEIFTPDELKALLSAAMHPPTDAGMNRRYAQDQGMLPLLVLGAFAGLRTAEVERQLWSDIHLDANELVVTAEKGNTAQNRIVPISRNLKQWLTICKKTADTCCNYGRTAEAIGRLAERAGIRWKHNGLRHSYISYRVAETQDVPKVALEAGNSPEMIFRHYRKPLPPRAAPNWFAITPKSVERWYTAKKKEVEKNRAKGAALMAA
jgi:site-specific recombinase XerD